MESFEGSRVLREDRIVNNKMKELRTAIEINASADTVWAILTDLSQFAAWNPFMPEAEGEVREGARLKVRIAPPGGKASTR